MIPRVLRNFNSFVNGVGYAGRISEVELPELSVKTEEYRGGGMDGNVELDMGLETLTAKFTFGEHANQILGLWGNMDGNAVRIQLRGALQRDGETAVPMTVDLHGGFKKNTLGTWKAGDLTQNEAEMSIRYLKIQIQDTVVVEIDIDNMIRIVNGVDQLASIRTAMGM
ncbi:P2 family phage contractile tail tube protein [Bradyrhizobium japonicum]|uniref:phage major tail tube protein n=1 Tax=Bradyrhizobium japonicum TaxID=375 RepID=UPI00209E563C|nr:phage major tail tube protein [Bradyrhizobium japonicum]MCP1738601.1 P2 family phage contractile tail tube protein [Bradyrhizobium japonicum]MCW2320058.1 P2 family phage contractile tail tube protein [Bradyrhizobium japonicum]WLB95698.1 phage major tail tube protein [Bradyrhizobium japonicum USDA 123]